MKRWTWLFVAVAVAVNVLLLTVYLNRKQEIRTLFNLVAAEPSPGDLVFESQSVVNALAQSTLITNVFRDAATASSQLGNAIAILEAPRTDDPLSFFSEQGSLTDTEIDSLASAIQHYERALSELWKWKTPAVTESRDGYKTAVRIQRMASAAKSGSGEMNALQKELNTLTDVVARGYRMSVSDAGQLDNLVYYLGIKSCFVNEMKLNNQILALDKLFPSKGRAELYGKHYDLKAVTAADRHQIYRKAVMVKRDLDRNLLDTFRR